MAQTIISWITAISIILKTEAENQLHNDTCGSVKMNNITSNIAQIVCNKDAKIFDPTHQKGILLFDKNTSSWKSEIFSCQCNCHLIKIPENGQIVSKTIGHGETFEYKCNEGFYKTINKKIICYDGVLMLVPDNLEDYNISTAFRQKGLPVWFISEFLSEIFQLAVNETYSWTIHESEVGRNQKYIQILSINETVLVYYLFNGVGYKIGLVDLKTRLKPACIRTESPLSGGEIAGIAIGAGVIIILILVAFYFCKQERCSRRSEPTTEPNETHSMLNQQTTLNTPTTEPNETHSMLNQQTTLNTPTTEPNETHSMLNQITTLNTPTTEPNEILSMLNQQTTLNTPTIKPNETHSMLNRQTTLNTPTTDPNETSN